VTGLRTTSLRSRVTLTALGVLGVVLLAAGIAVHAVVTTQAEHNLNTLLAGRVQLAKQLARADVAPAALVRRVDGPGLVVHLRLPSGEVLGETPPESDVRVATARLTGSPRLDGARLTITADTTLLSDTERTLRGVLFGAGLVALVLTALGLVVGVRFALVPLDGMTGLARSIAAGRRGGRLRPTRPATELGRTATAFDEMLDALEGAERTARESEERVRRFVADATHELRTPIAGVRAAAEALLSTGDDVEQRERLLLLLVRESSRAGHLVDDLLELARIDAGLTLRATPVDLLALANDHAERVRLLAPGVAITVTGDQVWVTGDADRLTQVLTNLTDNARRAMTGSGTLTIDVRRAGPALLTVTDSGPGIPPEDHERVFDRLVRLDEARTTPGAGLGLPIARGIARAHGGDLRCLPAVRGATFELRLP
jgi:signal transduction histidine kinase